MECPWNSTRNPPEFHSNSSMSWDSSRSHQNSWGRVKYCINIITKSLMFTIIKILIVWGFIEYLNVELHLVFLQDLKSTHWFWDKISRVISLDLRDWMLNSINYARHQIPFSVRNHFPLALPKPFYPDFHPLPLTSISLDPLFAVASPSRRRAQHCATWSLAPVMFSPLRGHCVCALERDVWKGKQKHVGISGD